MKLFSFAAQAALSALVVVGVSASTRADVLFEYNFDDANAVPTVLNPQALAGTFTPGAGGGFAGDWFEPTPGAPREQRGWYAFRNTTADDESGAPSASFSLGAITGYALELDQLVFDAAFMGTAGQGTLGFRFVSDGAAIEKAITVTRFPNFSQYAVSLAGLNVLSDTLKVYAFDANGGPGAHIRLDNVQVHGSVVADAGTGAPVAPEPTTLALVGLGAAGLGAVRLRQRRREQQTGTAA